MVERWVPIAGYGGRYEVSDCGRVRNDAGRVLRPRVTSRGYLAVGLYARETRKQREHKMHRLVADAFVERPPECREVNHKDLDKHNNNASNLEWVTRSGNYWHAHAAGLYHGGSNPNRITKYSAQIIAEIRARRANGAALGELADEFGMNRTYAHRVTTGKMRKNG